MARQQPVRHLHPKKHKEPFDYLVYFFVVATPLFELPQSWAIHSSKSAENVSVITWLFFFISSFVWLVYAIKHKLKPLIVMYCIYILVDASIVIGIIMYS